MQQLKEQSATWYFAIGSQKKSSLSSQFCRENNFLHLVDPVLDSLKPHLSRPAIIEAPLSSLSQLQKLNPNLRVLLVSKPNNKEQQDIAQLYAQLGYLKYSKSEVYQQFCKVLYPNLVFVYGPVKEQNKSVSESLAEHIGYRRATLLESANQYISKLDKCQNLVVDGLFADANSVKILSSFFNIRVIHLKYERVDLPLQQQFFDKQYLLGGFLQNKPYYIPVSAKELNILENIGERLCPKLIYVSTSKQEQYKYLQSYIEQTNGLLVDFLKLQRQYIAKGLPVLTSQQSKLAYLSSILYKDLDRKQIVIANYPESLPEILQLQKRNRKISLFVDLAPPEDYKFTQTYSSRIYFLENQKYIQPNRPSSLLSEISDKIEYWIISGAAGTGKTSVGKLLASDFGYKLIEFQTYLPTVKEKLANPDEGEEVPVKKIIQYFRQLLTNDSQSVYVLDGFPYDNKELQEWVQQIGAPNVIHLQVEQPEQIKRSRRKAESDVNAEVGEQQLAKTNQSNQKSQNWVNQLRQFSSESHVYTVDFNSPQIIAQKSIYRILQPRIFFIQKNKSNLYQNIALRYGLGFINLNKQRLRDCTSIVKKLKKRDIVLCNHGHEKKRLASQDLYWVQKNLGIIRYLGIWEEESKSSNDQILELEKPKVPEKVVAAEGEANEQKPPEDPPAEGEGEKKKFDIYAYEWTKPGDYKNLSQWFFKSKHNITQLSRNQQQCYTNFTKIVQILNQSAESNVYDRIH